MFSFINFIQSILKKIKRNKGLWFTLLTVISTMGIAISMLMINMMTKSVAEKTYMKVYRVNATLLENVLDQRYDTLLSIANIVSIAPNLVANIKSKSDIALNEQLAIAEKTINDNVGIDPIAIRYYASNYKASKSENFHYAELVMSSGSSITGIVVNKVGTRVMVIAPVMDANKTIGAIEISQDIASIRNDLEKFGKEFAFLIDKSQLAFIDLAYKQGNIEDISERFKIFFHDYNPAFYTYLTHIDFNQLAQTKYHVDKSYYIDYYDAMDIDGKTIGAFIIGEKGQEEDSFVNITQDLIKSVTTVALGLVISLILFMF